jgi:hypothetical protein
MPPAPQRFRDNDRACAHNNSSKLDAELRKAGSMIGMAPEATRRQKAAAGGGSVS